MRLEKIGNIKANPNNPRIIKDDSIEIGGSSPTLALNSNIE